MHTNTSNLSDCTYVGLYTVYVKPVKLLGEILWTYKCSTCTYLDYKCWMRFSFKPHSKCEKYFVCRKEFSVCKDVNYYQIKDISFTHQYNRLYVCAWMASSIHLESFLSS